MRQRFRGRVRDPLLWMAAACLLLAVAFHSLASEVLERETGAFDRAVRAWTLAHRSPAGLTIFGAITWLGARAVLVPAALTVAWFTYRRGARWRALAVLAAPVAFALLVALLKQTYGVVRPPSAGASTLGFSFPSGHASAGTATALTLCYVLARERVTRVAAAAMGLVVALLVGVSRVYLDVHWASDVLGGWLVGAAIGLACCALYEWSCRTAPSSSPPA